MVFARLGPILHHGDVIKDPEALRRQIEELFALKSEAEEDETRARIQKRIDAAFTRIDRSIAVYGMITLRTDGRSVIIAQKLERPRGRTREEFDIHQLEPGPDGLEYRTKH